MATRRSSRPRRCSACSSGSQGAGQPGDRRARHRGRPIPAAMAGWCSAPTARSTASSSTRTPARRSARSACAIPASWRSTVGDVCALLDRVDNNNAKGEFYLTDIVAHAPQGRPALRRGRSAARGGARRQQPGRAGRGRSDVPGAAPRLAAMENGATPHRSRQRVLRRRHQDRPRRGDRAPTSCSAPASRSATACEIRAFCHIEGAMIGDAARGRPVRALCARRRARRGRAGRQFRRDQEARSSATAPRPTICQLSRRRRRSAPKANIGAGTITCNYDGFCKYPHRDRRGRVHRLEHARWSRRSTIGDGADRRRRARSSPSDVAGRRAGARARRAGRQAGLGGDASAQQAASRKKKD